MSEPKPGKRPATRPATGGRKSKLTPELIAQVDTSLRAHASVEATCEMLGISRETFYRWIREGEEATRGLKSDFSDTVKKAQGMSQVMLINKISSDPSWQAKAWLLERLHPKRYGRRQLIAHAGADGESDLPTPTAPVNLVIKMVAAPGQANPTLESDPDPFIMKDGTDPEPHNGSDPWESDKQAWPEQHPDLPPEPAEPPMPTRGSPGFPTGQINTAKPSPLDTGGRSRDPDEP